MKRRGFFGALAGLVAAPVVAKAIPVAPEDEACIVTVDKDGGETLDMAITAPLTTRYSASWDDECDDD